MTVSHGKSQGARVMATTPGFVRLVELDIVRTGGTNTQR